MLEKSTQTRRLKALHKTSPIGIDLLFCLEGNTARTQFVLNENHQGPSGLIHNGILACLMDVAMGWIARHIGGVNSVTAKMDIDYRRQARTGEPLIMTALITKNSKRLLEEKVRIEDQSGGLIAEGTCIQFIMGLNTGSVPPGQPQADEV
jgi:uncharacterized protein (TIGR00369 family)